MAITLVCSLLLMFVAAHAQSCVPKAGVLRMVQADTCRNNIALMECLGKIQLSTSEFCSVQVQPDVRVSMDGTFCEPSQGVERGTIFGKLNLGFSHLQFEFKNSPVPGLVAAHLDGRFVPNEGGLEAQVDCNMLYNVTAGTVLGVVSQGQDNLASMAYTGGGYSGGAYTGAASEMPQQQARPAGPPGLATSAAQATCAAWTTAFLVAPLALLALGLTWL